MKQLTKLKKEKLGIKLKVSDISGTVSLGKKKSGKTRNLNVTFNDTMTREKVFKQRKKLITEKQPSRNIYINDCLTKHRQSVLYSCRKQVQAKKLFAAWSQGGNILIRKEENGKILQILDHDDLRDLDSVPSVGAIDPGRITPGNSATSGGSSTVTHLSNYSFGYESDM